jgi:hypothetical protein
MKSADDVGITFANLVVGQGYMNGVVNLTLAAFAFTPDEKTEKVDPDPVIVSRLRMDEACATQLRDSLNSVLQSMADARVKAAVDAHAVHEASNGVDRKPESIN